MIFPWRFKISPKKNTRGATILQQNDSPLFAGLAPPIARARYLTTCPENSPAPQPKPARLSGNARFDEIPGWFGENKKVVFFEGSVTEGWKRRPKDLWKMSFLFVFGKLEQSLRRVKSFASLWGAQLNKLVCRKGMHLPQTSRCLFGEECRFRIPRPLLWATRIWRLWRC